MFLLISRVSRVGLVPRRSAIQCSHNFFKLSFRTPTKPQQQCAKANARDKSVDTKRQKQQEQLKEQPQPQPEPFPPPQQEMKPQPKSQLPKPQVPTTPISIKDQRDKWMAKVSPEMQRKAKLKANSSSGGGVSKPGQSQMHRTSPNPQPFGMSNQFEPPAWQQKNKRNEMGQSDGGSATGAERKSWMNRMHGAQQKKQAQWLQDMQAKQQAGRDMQQQKMQKLKLAQPKADANAATFTGSKAASAAAAEPLTEEEPEPKTPERLAYLDAVRQLNSYQIHEPVAGRAQSKSSRSSNQVEPNIEHTLQCLSQTGFDKQQLELLPVIQVAGSKGRGTTCILVEAILRAHGVKTGVLCAPHLFLTSERIRIDGEPLSETEFTQLFQQLISQLSAVQPPPSYNKLLTVMAFHAFHNADVDVAIVEVGSGCASDCTNVASHARTIGISALGWEQCFSLSNSMRDIAWAKAAIMKPEASIYTSASQTECCEVLSQRAKQLGVQLHRVPSYTSYIEANMSSKKLLNGANFAVRLNGSLAIQLAYDYLRRYKPEYVTGVEHNCTQLTPGATRGIEMYEQRGQFEMIKHNMFNVYLDSADTLESMMMCREWFYTRTRSSRSPKILLFNKVNEFNSKDLLTILRHNMRFEEACFVPSPSNFEGEPLEGATDQATKDAITWHSMEELQRARRNASNWRSLCEENSTRDNSQLSISIESFFEHLLEKYGRQRYGMRNDLDILVTGSRELVAGTIKELQNMKNDRSGKWQ